MTYPLKISHYAKSPFGIFILLTCTIAFTAFLGIASRPLSFLATLWIPNALLLGLFLRFPHLNQWPGWLGAFVGFMLADLLTGNNIFLTTALTFANLINVSVALALIKLFRLDHTKYNQGLTFFYLFIIISMSSLIGALFAILTVPHMPNTFMGAERLTTDFTMWWTGEIQNMVLILPIILSLPTSVRFNDFLHQKIPQIQQKPALTLPFIAVILCTCIGYYFSGPGALMFPIASMLWAALSYQLFTIALLNLLVCSLLFYSVTQFYLSFSAHDYLATTVSARIGMFMMALAPLTVGLINQNRTTLYKQLRQHVDFDALTQAMSRRNFMESAVSKLKLIQPQNRPFALLMIDLDYFKNVNDTYGHHVGDVTLQHFVKITQQTLRQNDLFGRLGGEEFAIFLADIQANDALKIAKRIQANLEQAPLILSDQSILCIRISIGLLHHTQADHNLEELLTYADQALYKAKALGRNQVYVTTLVN